MIKKGFTLAEVLITLGVVGVIAAITLPSLLADTASAQIGPKLAKSVSMLEQANESLLNENASDTLIDTGFWTSASVYTGELEKYLKGSASGTSFNAKDGVKYTFTKEAKDPTNTTDPAHKQKIGTVKIDINGDAKPDADATDVFYFSFWNDGSVRPKGGTNWNGGSAQDTKTCEEGEEGCTAGQPLGASDRDGGSEHWKTQCKKDAAPTDTAATYCAGHIFENNLKVFYK